MPPKIKNHSKKYEISSPESEELPVFHVDRIHRKLKKKFHGLRLHQDASVYLAAVLEYLTAEVVTLSKKLIVNNKRIMSSHVKQILQTDPELNILLSEVTIPTDW
ncbi:Late histone H2A.1 like protein [Argiope bruennichi]|uniref:Histone H2A n=1 Tax=Argiope bruennichi TaxID=94029 RepID=A0A8T0EQW5_ARGBR|nr:Late histone H2A.1 like protein [Argiope bruennichi]